MLLALSSPLRPSLCLLCLFVVAFTAHAVEARQEAAPREVSFEAADGVTVYADVYDAVEGSRAPLALLFHQAGSNGRGEYVTVVPRLLAAGYNVLAVDLRSGGDRFGGANRTVAALAEDMPPYCAVYPDLEATLAYAEGAGFTGPRFAWGSSYSAALAIRLGAEHPDALAGVLAFSPASGGPMADCSPDVYADTLTVPLLLLRPASEMSVHSVSQQFDLFAQHGHQTHLAPRGVHGASMLDPTRSGPDTEAVWKAVFDFLDQTLGR